MNVPPYVQGTYTYHDNGYAITVGYICPGATGDVAAEYFAQIVRKGTTIQLTAHGALKLDDFFSGEFGFHLSDAALQVLADDAVTVVC